MTELEYLNDTYKFESIAKVIDFKENEFGKYLILDKTIFYPQGGGQPSDTGIIKSGEKVFFVEKVKIDESGVVYHYGKTDFIFNIGEEGNLTIDKENRIFNAKNHSAGHLIDVAMKRLGLGELIPTKGYHFREGCYVEYEGDFRENIEEFTNKLNVKLNELVNQNLKIIVNEENIGNLKSPNGKKPRYVSFEGESGCGCGGTHVLSSGKIGEINVRKVKYKGNVLKVSYEVK